MPRWSSVLATRSSYSRMASPTLNGLTRNSARSGWPTCCRRTSADPPRRSPSAWNRRCLGIEPRGCPTTWPSSWPRSCPDGIPRLPVLPHGYALHLNLPEGGCHGASDLGPRRGGGRHAAGVPVQERQGASDRRRAAPGLAAPTVLAVASDLGRRCQRETFRSAGGSRALVARESRHVSDRKSTRLNSSHTVSSYAVFCL